jgi:hypothetical protein
MKIRLRLSQRVVDQTSSDGKDGVAQPRHGGFPLITHLVMSSSHGLRSDRRLQY